MYLLTSFLKVSLAASMLLGCQGGNLLQMAQKPLGLFESKGSDTAEESINEIAATAEIFPLSDLLGASQAPSDFSAGLSDALKVALENDPSLSAEKSSLSARLSSVAVTEAGKDFQVSGTMLAGLEDISDKESGLALILSANRLMFDGGEIDSKISAQRYSVESARHSLEAKTNIRAMELTNIWVDFNKFATLNSKIEDRLVVLGPLIEQLEKVAEAGIGDVTRVSAAQRTVAAIEATQTEVREGLEQAKLNFLNEFGQDLTYNPSDFEFIFDVLPSNITLNALDAPAIKAAYSQYLSNEANLSSVRAKDSFKVGLESRIQKPFADSTYDSDEKVGLVIKRTIYDGKMLESEIHQAEAEVQASISEVQQTYRKGQRIILSAQKHIEAMEKALALVRETANNMEDEISYLKRQLIIGGSTLDSVLSAEARLYDIQAKEINYLAEQQKSVVSILSALGLMTKAVELSDS